MKSASSCTRRCPTKILRGGGGLFFFQAEDGIRDVAVTGVQTCALPISDVPPAGLEDELLVDDEAARHRVPGGAARSVGAERGQAAVGIVVIEVDPAVLPEIGRASCRERV